MNKKKKKKLLINIYIYLSQNCFGKGYYNKMCPCQPTMTFVYMYAHVKKIV